MKCAIRIALLASIFACGNDLPGNSPYQGSWNAFDVNGTQSLGGFLVDDHGRFQLSIGGVQVSGAIEPGGRISASAFSSSTTGSCVLTGSCTSTNACSGATRGACPADSSGAPWATFSACRGGSC